MEGLPMGAWYNLFSRSHHFPIISCNYLFVLTNHSGVGLRQVIGRPTGKHRVSSSSSIVAICTRRS
ncbi:hypothetical protein CY34DRAFT_812960 [Suillus luteus UH-Slu-Lm8-n1]|uniref:Uncharacterized protein n=1 Tax=Suillus luteus UH-Slu-Lm8-n1 TaxID=930992 RepID=A0A0C9ZA63_9AGAM|nr:hypothetical protein CY34DRAFT_812960 [Suillus luteus UH-Slu-Lm8-n1]